MPKISILPLIIDMGKINNISKDFRDFLSHDDQGMEGFEFMLKDSKLAKKIPSNIRVEYEQLYFMLSSQLEDNLVTLEEQIKAARENPTKIVHKIIQSIYEHDIQK